MNIGIPREIKADEYRVSLTPAGVRELVAQGHEVRVEQGAGEGSGFSDAMYAKVIGAIVVPSPEEVHEFPCPHP